MPLAVAMVGAQLSLAWSAGPSTSQVTAHRVGGAGTEAHRISYPSLIKAIHASVEALPADVPKLYSDVAVFREDCRIPLGALQTLWSERGISDFRTEYVLNLLVQRSLLFKSDDGRFYLHDLQLDYLRNMAENLPALHKTMVNAYAKRCSPKWATGPNDGYYFENLIRHMHSAGMLREARQTLLSLLGQAVINPVNNLIDDYEAFSDSNAAHTEAYAFCTHWLGTDSCPAS